MGNSIKRKFRYPTSDSVFIFSKELILNNGICYYLPIFNHITSLNLSSKEDYKLIECGLTDNIFSTLLKNINIFSKLETLILAGKNIEII